MSRSPIIKLVESIYQKPNPPTYSVGDTVNVHTLIVEGAETRKQIFKGVVIAKNGEGLSENFTVYRTAYGSSMERVFMLHSPRISDIEVVRPGKVRRAKLYYLRGRTGKSAKIQERFTSDKKVAAVEEQPQS